MTKEVESILFNLSKLYSELKEKDKSHSIEKDNETVAKNKAIEIENDMEKINHEITNDKKKLFGILGEQNG